MKIKPTVMKSQILFIAIFCLSLAVSAQNTPPTLKGQSPSVVYGQKSCIDISTEDVDGDSVFVGVISQIPQSQVNVSSSVRKYGTISTCVTPVRGIHIYNSPNSMLVYATDKKDTTYRTFSVNVLNSPYNVKPVIEKVNYNTFNVDLKGNKTEPWETYGNLRLISQVFDIAKNKVFESKDTVFSFTAPNYQKYILHSVYYSHGSADVYVSIDTLYPDMNVSVISPQQNFFTIYPNPTTESFFIENLPQKVKAITVFNALGKELKKLNTASNSFSIESLPSGIYWVEVETQQGVLGRQKLIKVD